MSIKKRIKKPRPLSISFEPRAYLEGLAESLDAHVHGTKSLEAWEAEACLQIVRRILNPPHPNVTASQGAEAKAAYAYFIRLELYGSGKWKKARGDTATAHKMADTSISKYATRWGKYAQEQLERAVSTMMLAFPGDDIADRRKQILEFELEVVERDPDEQLDRLI